MFFKLLLISQLLALTFAQLSVEEAKKLVDASVYSDEETGDDTHQPEPQQPPQYQSHYPPQHGSHHPDKHVKITTPEPETTTEPQLVTENNATATPDGLGQLDDGLGQVVAGTAVPESTTEPEPETTTTTSTTSTTTTTTTAKPHKHIPHPYTHTHPHPHPFPHPYPYPYPYPQQHAHPYGQPGLIFIPTGPKPAPASESSSSPNGVGYSSYPNFRSPYSPYQPHFFQGPGHSPSYGYPEEHNHEEDSAENKAMDKSEEGDGKKPEDVPLRPPGFGYPSVYLVPRRPVITVQSFPRSGGGYGSPYSYGRY